MVFQKRSKHRKIHSEAEFSAHFAAASWQLRPGVLSDKQIVDHRNDISDWMITLMPFMDDGGRPRYNQKERRAIHE